VHIPFHLTIHIKVILVKLYASSHHEICTAKIIDLISCF